MSRTSCWYTWRGFREHHWVLIKQLTECLNTSKLLHWEITLLYFVLIFDTSIDALGIMRLLSQITFDFTDVYTHLYKTLHSDKLLNVPASFTTNMFPLQLWISSISAFSIILHKPKFVSYFPPYFLFPRLLFLAIKFKLVQKP